jgi:16S rRNA (guanine527-N7)-methyltransferase
VLSRLLPPREGWPFSRAATILGESLPPSATEHLSLWLDRLAEWNAGVDLTAARSSDELVDLMVADALVLSPHLPEGARVVDVGTGAGAPGLAMAILRPDLRVTLVEPLGKRRAFLRSVIGSLNRLDVTLEGKPGEGLALEREGAWDVALSRATLPPAAWLSLAERLLAHEGSAWVFLARESPPTLAGMTEADALSYAWPLTGSKRRLIRYEKGGARVREGG